MAPDAASQDVLYVTDSTWISVYSYPSGHLKGMLTGFDSTVGLCVDKSGNVYATNGIPAKIYVYAHGGKKRIRTLSVGKGILPVGCSIDPTTGNLAVTGFSQGADIFDGARGTPKFIKDKAYYEMQFCAYDDKGNLFVNGWGTQKRSAVAELQKGATEWDAIDLDTPTDGDAGLQWTGTRLAVGGYDPAKSQNPVIYRYLISGLHGEKKGTTPLGTPGYEILQFLIDGTTVIVPNWAKPGTRHLYSVLYYAFPEGGDPEKAITRRMAYPRGVVISRS